MKETTLFKELNTSRRAFLAVNGLTPREYLSMNVMPLSTMSHLFTRNKVVTQFLENIQKDYLMLCSTEAFTDCYSEFLRAPKIHITRSGAKYLLEIDYIMSVVHYQKADDMVIDTEQDSIWDKIVEYYIKLSGVITGKMTVMFDGNWEFVDNQWSVSRVTFNSTRHDGRVDDISRKLEREAKDFLRGYDLQAFNEVTHIFYDFAEGLSVCVGLNSDSEFIESNWCGNDLSHIRQNIETRLSEDQYERLLI